MSMTTYEMARVLEQLEDSPEKIMFGKLLNEVAIELNCTINRIGQSKSDPPVGPRGLLLVKRCNVCSPLLALLVATVGKREHFTRFVDRPQRAHALLGGDSKAI